MKQLELYTPALLEAVSASLAEVKRVNDEYIPQTSPLAIMDSSLKSREDLPARIAAKCEMSKGVTQMPILGSSSSQTTNSLLPTLLAIPSGQKNTDSSTASESPTSGGSTNVLSPAYSGSRRGEILTFSGIYIDPINPDPLKINLWDIAHALGNICRFGGHCPVFYSVAEHSVRVLNIVKGMYPRQGWDLKAAALFHDAEEAYLLDIPTPIKRSFPEYAAAGDRLRKVIFDSLNIPYHLYAIIKEADEQAYWEERKELWERNTTVNPYDASKLFMKEFYAL